MSVSNLAVMREGEKRREKGNDIIFLELNNQISQEDGQNDYFENGIKLSGPKWKISNLRQENENNPWL